MATFAFSSIAQALREEIAAGTYPVGSSLPSERELSQRFAVSPGTVRVALKELVAEGTVDGIRGRQKTVIRMPRKQAQEEFRSFAQWARQQALNPGGQVLSADWLIASRMDEELLRVEPGRRVFSVLRLRTLNGDRVMLEHTHYPEWLGEIVATIPRDAASVTGVLAEDHDVHFSHAEHVFAAEGARAKEAERLGVSRGSALLVHRRISRDPSGRPLEWSTDRYISGKIMIGAGSSWHSSSLKWTLPGAEPWDS